MCLEGVKDLRGKNFIYLHFKSTFMWHSKCYYLLSMNTYSEPKYYENVLMDFMTIFYFETLFWTGHKGNGTDSLKYETKYTNQKVFVSFLRYRTTKKIKEQMEHLSYEESLRLWGCSDWRRLWGDNVVMLQCSKGVCKKEKDTAFNWACWNWTRGNVLK